MDMLDSIKLCPYCGETKSGREFGVHLHKSKAKKPTTEKIPRLATYCYECRRVQQKTYRDGRKGGARKREKAYRARPEVKARLKLQRVRRQYGISEEQYAEMLARQGNKCAACGGQSHDGILRVDHCHITEEVRGLLCNNCNAALGFLQDDPERIQGLFNYIAEYKKSHPGKSAKSLVR